jgi:hypothetical protein
MSNKIVFFNTGWMDLYQGIKNRDTISGGGKHVDTHGWGGEMYNFNDFENNLYGYVQPKIDRLNNNPSIIKLERIGGLETDSKIHNVTVVWTATNPVNRGTYVIGWYKNATVYRNYQEPPKKSNRKYKKHLFGFFAKAKSKDCKLLSRDERIMNVRRQEKNWMGQSNVWYAENNPVFVKQIKDYIFKNKSPIIRKTDKGKEGIARQSDPLKRIEVELKAVKFVTKYYENLGYEIESFEKDNVGWDLTASNNKAILKLEVKGLSGKNISTELTPNEFENLKSDKVNYRVCIVTDALMKPKLKVFAFSKEKDDWISEDGTILSFVKVISARIFTSQ